MMNQSACLTCAAGTYFTGLGSTTSINCTYGLTPELKQQAQATTVVVSSVVAMVVSASAAGAVGGSVAGGAASGGSGGSSIFQLIQAAQFMNIFGKLINKKQASSNSARRSSDAANTANSSQASPDSSGSSGGDGGNGGEASVFRFNFANLDD